MNEEQQRITIAQACGWELKSNGLSPMWSWQNESLTHRIKWVAHKEMASQGVLPDYLNDLNACHEMEKALSKTEGYWQLKGFGKYCNELSAICGEENIIATAAQRAEAFLRTIGKWTTNPNEL
jgi:hypothetical protein